MKEIRSCRRSRPARPSTAFAGGMNEAGDGKWIRSSSVEDTESRSVLAGLAAAAGCIVASD